MSDSDPKETESGADDSKSALPDWAVALFAVEAIAVLIGLAMPIAPSKTGSTWNPAQLFSAEPSYLSEVAFWIVATNVLVLAIGFVAWVYSRIKR